MYTTPRKVKQESRLRRSLSLTNPGANATELDPQLTGTELYPDPLNQRGVTDPGFQLPPPYRLPPNASSLSGGTDLAQERAELGITNGSASESNHNNHTFQTHSSKFPIVKEVILSTQQFQQEAGRQLGQTQTDNSADKLAKKSQLGWKEDRKSLTLDSSTGREFEQKLGSNPTKTLRRRNSLDLEKFIQIFNEEQILMASMQGRHLLDGSGIDNPALDLGPHSNHHQHMSNGNQGPAMYGQSNGQQKGSGGYFPDSASMHSQSLSLSSSNTDSMDTVIYKIPTSQAPTIGSVRDWQEQQQRSGDTGADVPLDLNHRGEPNSFRDTNHLFDSRGYQIQQQGLPYQPASAYSGQPNYAMEYRSSQQQQHLQQQQHHLQHPAHAHHQQQNSGQSNSHGVPSHALRAGNPGNPPTSAYNGSSSNSHHLSSKSPVLGQKQFSTAQSSDLSLDKSKESTKLFHTKTYNHIKDMISSRFGGPNGNPASGNPNNNNKTVGLANGVSGSDRNLNNSVLHQSNGNASYNGVHDNAGLPNPHTAYGAHHHHNHANSVQGYGHNPGNGGPAYYVVPQNASPNSSGLPPVYNGHPNPPPSSYRSPPMNDRKNVNTSFRKAIQKSTQKSNLAEESLQMRSMSSESQSQNYHQDVPVNGNGLHSPSSNEQHHSQHQQAGFHAERAKRALDNLLDPMGSQPPSRPETFQSNQNHVQYRNQQAYPSEEIPVINPGRHGFNTSNPSATSSNGLTILEGHGQSYAQQPSKSLDEPPPLPTSQKPTHTQMPSLGLPYVRENGDGSSGTTDTGSKCTSSPEATEPGSKLGQLTVDLQGLTLSAGPETHSSSSEGEIKGSQRVGSGQSHTTTDSGIGTQLHAKSPLHSDNPNEPLDGLSGLRLKFNDDKAGSISSGNDSEWVDIVEPEIRQILEMERASKPGKSASRTMPASQSHAQHSSSQSGMGNTSQGLTNGPKGSGITTEMASSHSHQLNPHRTSPAHSPKLPKKFDLNNYNKKSSQEVLPGPSSGQSSSISPSKGKAPRLQTQLLRSNSGSGQQRSNPWNSPSRSRPSDKGKSSTVGRKDLVSQTKAGKLTRSAMSQILYSLHDDNGDMTSTTTGLDLESMLDGPTENTSDDDDLSTTIDTTDAHAIRRQLESLESMYTEVLKVLGGRKYPGGAGRYPPPVSDLRNAKRRPFGSMSSLPSSVSSRPFRETKKRFDDKKKVKDIKSINRRFQRLESHVVTLARSVAHLSSEMRTQHLMVQEMESIRNELSQLRSQVLKTTMQNQSAAAIAAANGQAVFGRGSSRHGTGNAYNTDWTSFRNALPSLTNPCRVRKLTKFFGDEPPLIRIFLKKLGYEKYALHFEQERIGIMELPYLTEERLQKMGIPMGPRLRILQEAHMCLKPGSGGAQFTIEHPHHNGNTGNLSVYVV